MASTVLGVRGAVLDTTMTENTTSNQNKGDTMPIAKNATIIGTQYIVDMRKTSGLREYNELRAAGWRTLWSGEGQICLKKIEVKAV